MIKKHHRKNPEKYFKLQYPYIKISAIDNFHNELQRAAPDKEFKDPRTKVFQIFRILLSSPEFCSKITFLSTANIQPSDVPIEPTENWINHSPLDDYFKNPENHVDDKYDGTSLLSFLRFIRNTLAHFLQAGDGFRIQILGTREMSRVAFCEFFDRRYPELLAFLVWMYACACEDHNEIVQLLGGSNTDQKDEDSKLPQEEKLELWVEEDLIEFLLEMINFFFGENSITREEIKVIIGDNLVFNNVGFSGAKPKKAAPEEKKDTTKIPKMKRENKKKGRKQKKGTYVPYCEKCQCTCPKDTSADSKSQ